MSTTAETHPHPFPRRSWAWSWMRRTWTPATPPDRIDQRVRLASQAGPALAAWSLPR